MYWAFWGGARVLKNLIFPKIDCISKRIPIFYCTQNISGCGVGNYLDANNACQPCDVNEYNDQEAATSCTSCGTGKYTDGTGSSDLTDCLGK